MYDDIRAFVGRIILPYIMHFGCNGRFQPINGAHPCLPKQSLELRKGLLNGIESCEYSGGCHSVARTL